MPPPLLVFFTNNKTSTRLTAQNRIADFVNALLHFFY
jgi:hypothetical protein